ncbi:hypothetical protein P879_09707 [Paragonimus westermani]|uniref:DUF7041 domain-containing protein n=1 Tax=Paragonimus westermani TaxID=34504 RepID=A0A8T0DDD8_9TREM|nr:hypothetical protein P879_09707 [Paragonimus westermani]
MSGDTQLANSSVSPVNAHISLLWNNDPVVWFRLAEVQFEPGCVAHSYAVFSHVVLALPIEVQEAGDVITHLKATSLKRTTDSEQRRLEQLFSGEKLGDR